MRLLRDAEGDLAKGLTVSDVCRKLGIAENTYYRWRQQHDPAQVDESRRIRQLRPRSSAASCSSPSCSWTRKCSRRSPKKVVTA
jgi:transposase-like protein